MNRIGNYCYSIGENVIDAIFHDKKDDGIVARVSDYACIAFAAGGFSGLGTTVSFLLRAGIEWGSHKLVTSLFGREGLVSHHQNTLKLAKYTVLFALSCLVLLNIACLARQYLHAPSDKKKVDS